MNGLKVLIYAMAMFCLMSGLASAYTNISACGTLSAGTEYRLTADLTAISGTCFTFGGNNILFKCQGHIVGGDATGTDYGFTGISRSNVTVRDCKNITKFNLGVWFKTGTNDRVINNTFYANAANNVRIESGTTNNVSNNKAYSCTSANCQSYLFSGSGGTGSYVYNNIANGSTIGTGFYLLTNSNSKFISNKAINNYLNGFDLESGTNNTINKSYAIFSNQSGILIKAASTGHTIVNSQFCYNQKSNSSAFDILNLTSFTATNTTCYKLKGKSVNSCTNPCVSAPAMAAITPNPSYKSSILTTSVSSAATPVFGYVPTYYTTWFLANGSVLRQGVGSSYYTLNCSNTSLCKKGNTIYTQTFGYYSSSNSPLSSNQTVLISNSPPTNPTTVSLSPNPTYIGNLNFSASGSTDIDGDAITYAFWLYDINTSSVIRPYSIVNYYGITCSHAHHTIKLRAIATTSDANSSGYKELNRSLSNSIPTPPSSITVAPLNAQAGTMTTATISGSTDADCDALSYYMKVVNQNHSITRQAYSLNHSYFIQYGDDNDYLRYYGKANDGISNSSEYFVSIFVPTVGPILVSLTPLLPSKWDNLYCAYDFFAPPITITFYRDGIANKSLITNLTAANVSLSYLYLNDGDQWLCVISNGVISNASNTITVQANQIGISNLSSINGTTWMSTQLSTFIGGNILPLAFGIGGLGIAFITMQGLGLSAVAFAYGVICLVFAFMGLPIAFGILGILSLIVGGVLKNMGS